MSSAVPQRPREDLLWLRVSIGNILLPSACEHLPARGHHGRRGDGPPAGGGNVRGRGRGLHLALRLQRLNAQRRSGEHLVGRLLANLHVLVSKLHHVLHVLRHTPVSLRASEDTWASVSWPFNLAVHSNLSRRKSHERPEMGMCIGAHAGCSGSSSPSFTTPHALHVLRHKLVNPKGRLGVLALQRVKALEQLQALAAGEAGDGHVHRRPRAASAPPRLASPLRLPGSLSLECLHVASCTSPGTSV